MTRIYLALAILSVAGFVWLLSRGDPLYAYFSLFLTPVVGVALSRVLIPLVGDSARGLRYLSLRRWEGLYFEYGSRHLRAVRRDDQLLFFERDILAAIGRRASQETPHFDATERVRLGRRDGYALTQAGCNRLLRKSAHPDARPLLLHLEREAFGPFAKRIEYERLAGSPASDQGRADTTPPPAPDTPKSSDNTAR